MTEEGNFVLYHNVPPWVKVAYNVSSVATLLLGVISVLMSLIQGGIVSASFVLLAMNLLLTVGLAATLWWWYRTGELTENRIFLMFIVMAVFVFQCIITDTWVFNYTLNEGELIPGTVVPPTTQTPILPNVTHVTMATVKPK